MVVYIFPISILCGPGNPFTAIQGAELMGHTPCGSKWYWGKGKPAPLLPRHRFPTLVLKKQVLPGFLYASKTSIPWVLHPKTALLHVKREHFLAKCWFFSKANVWAWIMWRQKSSCDVLQSWDKPLFSLQSSLRNVCYVILPWQCPHQQKR